MSAPFEFNYNGTDGQFDLGLTPDLCRAIHDWANDEFGPDEVVFGTLAFDDDKRLVGLRVEAHGEYRGPQDDNKPVEGTEGAWDAMVEWLHTLGVRNMMTFVRRAQAYGHGAQPGQWDVDMAAITADLAIESGLKVQGHILTDGSEHGLMPALASQAEQLLRRLGLDVSLLDEPIEGVANPFGPASPPAPEDRPDVPSAFYN